MNTSEALTLTLKSCSKVRIDWEDFEDITSKPSSSTARPHGKSAAAHDDDIDEDDEDPEDDAQGSGDEEENEDDYDFDA